MEEREKMARMEMVKRMEYEMNWRTNGDEMN